MKLTSIHVDKIRGNPNQPRKFFDENAMQELVRSICENGLKQPITVRPIEYEIGPAQYEIVMGERRWRAHKILAQRGRKQFEAILCNVKDIDDETMAIDAIIENLTRADIKPVEEARAFKNLIDQGWDTAKLANRLGVLEYRVIEKLSLLNLDESIQSLINSGNLATTSGVELAKLPKSEQITIAQKINAGTLRTITEIRAAVQAVLDIINQRDIFQDYNTSHGVVSSTEVSTVNAMERRIERAAELLSHGWKDGECVVASKVSPDRVRLMAERLAALRLSISRMERELKATAAQADMLATAQ